MIKVDYQLIKNDYQTLFNILIPLLELNPQKGEKDTDKLSVCNNSVWTIGLLSIYFPEESIKYIDKIFLKLDDILMVEKVRILYNYLDECIISSKYINLYWKISFIRT